MEEEEHPAGQIVAASGVFDLGVANYVESGATHVSPAYRGFGLQEMLFRLRIASVVVNQGPNVELTTAIKPSNTASRTNALKSGFVAWAQPIAQMTDPCAYCPSPCAYCPSPDYREALEEFVRS